MYVNIFYKYLLFRIRIKVVVYLKQNITFLNLVRLSMGLFFCNNVAYYNLLYVLKLERKKY